MSRHAASSTPGVRAPALRALLLALALLVVSLNPGPAAAFSVIVTDWGKVARYTHSDLTYTLGTYIPGTLGQSGLNAIEAGFPPWQQPSCTSLTMTKVGTTSVQEVMPTGADPNGINEVIYSQYNYWNHGNYVLGVTVPLYTVDGRIMESDIAFNPGTPWTLSTSGSYGSMSLQGVATHEIGHFFGQQHVLDYYGWGGADEPTMVPATSDGVKEITLSVDDQLGACFLYPAGSYTCNNNDECPDIVDTYSNGDEYYKGHFTCSGGVCSSSLEKEGTKGYGEECPELADCKSPYFCQPMSSGQICSAECNPQSPNCPNGDECIAYQDSTNIGVCFPTQHYPDGHDCASAYECDSGLCFPNPDSATKYCRQSCMVSQNNCPGGQSCISYTGIDYGGCIPAELIDPVAPVLKGVGEVCSGHADCASGVCGDYTCRKSCPPENDEACGPGMICTYFGQESGCTPGQPDPTGVEDGETCGGNTECKSGLCASLPGTTWFYCRSACVPGNACPNGTTCITYGDASAGVCMPQAYATGDFCSNNNDCSSAICHSTAPGTRQCVEMCNDTEPSCAPEHECVDDASYGPLCLPLAGSASGTTASGEPCGTDSECVSGLCKEQRCRERCNVFASACGAGEACDPMGDGNNGGCVPAGSGAMGGACSADEDCASAFCALLGDGGVCVGLCDRTAPQCPPGESCVELASHAVLGVCWQVDDGGGDNGGGGVYRDTGSATCAISSLTGEGSAIALWLAALAVLLLAAARKRAYARVPISRKRAR